MKNLMKISRKTDNALYITGWILIIAALSVTLAGHPPASAFSSASLRVCCTW